MEINPLDETTKFLHQRRPVFAGFPVAKPVVTQITIRHQMKTMDIIFPMTPLVSEG